MGLLGLLQPIQEWVYAHKVIGPIFELIGLFGPCWAFVSVINAAVNNYNGVLLMREWWYFTLSAVGCLLFALIIFLFVPAIVDPIQDQFKYQRRFSHLANKKWVAGPVFFFKFMDGFGRIWAFFSALQALISMILESDVWFASWWFWTILCICITAGLIHLAAWIAKAIRHGDVEVPRSQYLSSDTEDSDLGIDDTAAIPVPVSPSKPDLTHSLDNLANSFTASSADLLSTRSHRLVNKSSCFLIPLYFFQFQNGFGRMWAFFAMINAFCAVFGVILENYPLNWKKDSDINWVDSGWYMILALVGASFGGLLTLVQGIVHRKRVGELEKALLGEMAK